MEEKEIIPSSHLTAEQIAGFKEQEKEINGDYSENSWEAASLYDDLIEAKDTAWADHILLKMEDKKKINCYPTTRDKSKEPPKINIQCWGVRIIIF